MNESQHSDGSDLPGPIEVSPDPKRLRDGLAKRTGWRRRLFIRIRQPANVPGFFGDPPEELEFHFNKGVADLVAAMEGGGKVDLGTAEKAMAEAEAVYEETLTRLESAERRATTLQGAVAVAATVVVGSAGLVLNGSKVYGQGWKIAFAIGVLILLACLICCALSSLQRDWPRVPVRATWTQAFVSARENDSS